MESVISGVNSRYTGMENPTNRRDFLNQTNLNYEKTTPLIFALFEESLQF